MVFFARCRLGFFWISHSARVVADNVLRALVILAVLPRSAEGRDFGWELINVSYYLPFILLAPIIGALSNGFPKRWMLVFSAAYCLFLTNWFGDSLGSRHDSGLINLALIMMGAALFSSVCFALLPAGARDAR